jgi:predicted enzyme related to lactoylglutathione lyase
LPATTTRAVQGAPCWVSLMTRDLEIAQDFYGTVFGWRYKPGIQGSGRYAIALAQDAPVAGLGATARAWRLPVSWTVYFAADSADRAADRIRERSATVAVGPIRFGQGRLVCAADPDEALFSIWEGAVDPDWRMGGGYAAPAWVELRTRDPFAGALFYGEVFEWDAQSERIDIRYERDHVVVCVDGSPAAALYGGGTEAAPDPHIRPRWHVYFRVEDLGATVARVIDSGGAVVSPPSPSPFGAAAAICRDRQGGLFHVEGHAP